MSTLDKVRQLFLLELRKRGIAALNEIEPGVFVVDVRGRQFTVAINNLVRQFERSSDPRHIVHWVNAVEKAPLTAPAWPDAAAGIRFLAETADLDLSDAVVEPITTTLARVLVYITPDESAMNFLNSAQLARWEQPNHVILAAALRNMSQLIDDAELEIEKLNDVRVATIRTSSLFKASLIFAPNLKKLVAAELGWPVLAVVPCREVLYLIAEADRSGVGRLAKIVTGEYAGSSYPITTEVLKITDKGIKALGAFPAPRV